MESRVLKDVSLDLLVGGVVQQAGGVQAFQRELDTDGFARYLTLGKADNRLDMAWDNSLNKNAVIYADYSHALVEQFLLSETAGWVAQIKISPSETGNQIIL
jgi:hypothetical protein